MAGDFFYGKITARWGLTQAGAAGAFTVTKTGVANVAHSAAGLQISGDVAALVTIESPSGTILWRKRYTAAYGDSPTFPPGCIVGPAGADMLVRVSASTANSEVNLQGFSAMAG